MTLMQERPDKKGQGLRAFRTLLPYVKPHVHKIIGGSVALILIDLLQIWLPRFVRATIDLIVANKDAVQGIMRTLLPNFIHDALIPTIDRIMADRGAISLILWIALGMLMIGLITSVGRYFWRRWLAGSAIRVTADLRKDLLKHLQTLSYSFYNKQQVGDLMAHATNDLNAIMRAMMPGFVIIVDIIFMGILAVIYMLTLRWPLTGMLTVYAIIPLVVMSFFIGYFGKLLHTRFRAVRDSFSAMTARVTENLSGIRVVKAYVQEEGETASFKEKSADYVRKNISLIKIWGLFFPAIMFLSNLSLFLIMLLGGRMVILTQLTVGDFVAFQAYLGMLIWPMIAIGWVINLLQSGAASMGRINELLHTRPEIADGPDTLPLTEIEGSISFKNLTFQYPDTEHPALADISFDLGPGKILGIIGTVGSGKSTLVSLIPRLYEAPEGTLTVDGHTINKVPLKVLREAVGMVPQDIFLFSQTVAQNIAFGLKREVGQEEIEKAARIAGIHKEICKFPEGYETMLGERGVTVSGGQKQRLTIARAVLTDPRVLVLDDALSAVDSDTEIEILTALKGMMQKRAVIIISARPRSLAFADEILVLDEGRIAEKGKHEELLKNDGLYALFARLQGIES